MENTEGFINFKNSEISIPLFLATRPFIKNQMDIKLKYKKCAYCNKGQRDWFFYQIPCKCYVHTRCLRYFFKCHEKEILERKKILCPEHKYNIPDNFYCTSCKRWKPWKYKSNLEGTNFCVKCIYQEAKLSKYTEIEGNLKEVLMNHIKNIKKEKEEHEEALDGYGFS